MIVDTNFLSDLHDEKIQGKGPAMQFLAKNRTREFIATVISAGEFAVIFDHGWQAREFLKYWRILRLHLEVAYVAAQIDRELSGQRLGENDNWIAAFCRYYGKPLVSRDEAFDRVSGLRRIEY
jgi:predicted nucleic acid-binding protein